MDHSEVKHLPKVDHTPAEITKLSEAIRIGSLMSPQIENKAKYYACGGTCAIGAAAIALGYPINESEFVDPVTAVFKKFGHANCCIAIDLFYKLPTRQAVADALEARGL